MRHMMTEAVQPMALKRWLRAEASRLGFDAFGVTGPDPPPHLDVYADWLERGRHGEMGYLASDRGREARNEPGILLPQCKSILVLTKNYLPANPGGSGDTGARVATYARGDDYHAAIEHQLQELMSSFGRHYGRSFKYRIYTDTGPILERELAQRAGLGWIGKNTCLINPQSGSYFFLAEVLLDIELPFDRPFETDHCGSCTRCLDACPTYCILHDRTLDARRCISYLTIEHRSGIPEHIRNQLGDWVFGCDICQQVCPWNQRFARPTDDPVFQSRPWIENSNPQDYLELDSTGYQRVTRRSPLKRPKRRGLLRNAAVAAGNSGRAEYVEPLMKSLLEDEEPLVRAHAAWALGQLGGRAVREMLSQALKREREAEVSAEIRGALALLEED
jgi:epoxyqueuosine reductase